MVNHKRLRRLWREEGLRRPPPGRTRNAVLVVSAAVCCVPSIRTMCGGSTSSSMKPPISAG